MKIINSPAVMTAWAEERAKSGRRIALVPTMGCFHAGHLSLMQLAAEKGDDVIVSLFVNPMQFGPSEDFAAYPRNLEKDFAVAVREGVQVIFAPEPDAMYPEGFQTVVSVSQITAHLCGESRPGHFDGVVTVLVKLFNITRAHCAVFGEKDFQQLAVIRRMVADLNLGIEIIGHPIVREKDGLAMSSRNTYLGAQERKTALCLYESLQIARQEASSGTLAAGVLSERIREHILSFPGTEIEYVSLVDYRSLQPVEKIDTATLLALAVRINDRVRLIDNCMVFDRGAAA